MLRYELISKEWIVSPMACRIYRVSAYLSIALFFGLIAVLFEGGIPLAIAPFVRPLLFTGALAAGITLAGMECFLFRFDNGHPLKQAAWFCLMIFPLLGPALYCLVVYSHSDVLKNTSTEHSMSASAR